MTTIEKLIDKLKQREQLVKERQYFVFDALCRYILEIFRSKIFTQEDGYNRRRGYYIVSGSGSILFYTPPTPPISGEMYTYTIDVDSQYGSECVFNGTINKNLVFVFHNQDGTDMYARVDGEDNTVTSFNFSIPMGTTSIEVSTYGSIIIPSNFTLNIEVSEDVDVTSCVKNWDELEVGLKRDGLSGVMVELSIPIELVYEARLLLKEMFSQTSFHSRFI